MATVTSYDQAKIDELIAASVVTGAIDSSGNLTLTTKGGTVIPVGIVLESVPFASETQSGTIQIATAADITAGTDDTKAVSPSHLAAVVNPINTAVAGKQAADADLTAIANLSPAANDVLQYLSGAWKNQTLAQIGASLDTAKIFLRMVTYNGSAYVTSSVSRQYIGATDPATLGTVTDGSVWFDTAT